MKPGLATPWLAAAAALLILPAAAPAQDLAAQLAAAGRPEADLARDSYRRPVELVKFLGVKPGMTVLNVFAIDGYYSEVLAHAVGSSGKVVSQNNDFQLEFDGVPFYSRLQNMRLPNVKPIVTEVADISYPEGTFDTIFIADTWHDVFYSLPERLEDWPHVDRPKALRNFYTMLKPGGTIAISDYSTRSGVGDRETQTLFRLEEDMVKREFLAAGFVLDGESDILRVPADKRDTMVFDAAVIGKVDRYLLRFRKPG